MFSKEKEIYGNFVEFCWDCFLWHNHQDSPGMFHYEAPLKFQTCPTTAHFRRTCSGFQLFQPWDSRGTLRTFVLTSTNYYISSCLTVRHRKITMLLTGQPSISIRAIEKPWRTVSHNQRVAEPCRATQVAELLLLLLLRRSLGALLIGQGEDAHGAWDDHLGDEMERSKKVGDGSRFSGQCIHQCTHVPKKKVYTYPQMWNMKLYLNT